MSMALYWCLTALVSILYSYFCSCSFQSGHVWRELLFGIFSFSWNRKRKRVGHLCCI